MQCKATKFKFHLMLTILIVNPLFIDLACNNLRPVLNETLRRQSRAEHPSPPQPPHPSLQEV